MRKSELECEVLDKVKSLVVEQSWELRLTLAVGT